MEELSIEEIGDLVNENLVIKEQREFHPPVVQTKWETEYQQLKMHADRPGAYESDIKWMLPDQAKTAKLDVKDGAPKAIAGYSNSKMNFHYDLGVLDLQSRSSSKDQFDVVLTFKLTGDPQLASSPFKVTLLEHNVDFADWFTNDTQILKKYNQDYNSFFMQTTFSALRSAVRAVAPPKIRYQVSLLFDKTQAYSISIQFGLYLLLRKFQTQLYLAERPAALEASSRHQRDPEDAGTSEREK